MAGYQVTETGNEGGDEENEDRVISLWLLFGTQGINVWQWSSLAAFGPAHSSLQCQNEESDQEKVMSCSTTGLHRLGLQPWIADLLRGRSQLCLRSTETSHPRTAISDSAAQQQDSAFMN